MRPTTETINAARRELHVLAGARTTDHYEPSARTIALGAMAATAINGMGVGGYRSALAGLKRSLNPGHYEHSYPGLRDCVGRTVWEQINASGWAGRGEVRYANVLKAMAILERMVALDHYHREVAPQWVDAEKIHYADNSIVQYQVDRDGNRRHRTLVGPGGDICY